MTIEYRLSVEEFNNMVIEKKIEGLIPIDTSKYNYVEIDIDFTQDNISVWGCVNGSAVFFGDYITVDLDYLEEECTKKELCDLYIDNTEIAEYLKYFEIPYDWALDAIDEWRTPEQEEEEINEKEFWESVDGIKTAYKISREEN